MAMLAEPKRRQKYGNDPRNTLWSNDETKFGFRMLESMGWKKGKGLGASESGMTEHIKTVHRINSDVRGVGCSRSHADKWIAHQDDFNSLLSSLNTDPAASTSTDASTSSSTTVNLEEKSKSSKSRVHYHKFTRGKDLSRRSSTDLDCIFGKRKTPSSNSSTPTVQSEANSSDDSCEARPSFKQDDSSNSSCDSNSNNLHGIKTITSSSSVQEYFAMKMAELKRKREGVTSDSDKHESSGALGKSTDEATMLEVSSAEASEQSRNQTGKRKKKKSKRSSEEDSEEDSPEEGDRSAEVPHDSQADAEEVKCKSKKKERKLKGIVSELDYDVNDNCMSDKTTSENDKKGTDVESVLVDEVTEEGRSRVGKKKKKRSKRSDGDSEEESGNMVLENLDISKDAGEEQGKSKPKKKGKKDKSFVSKTDCNLNDNLTQTKHFSEEEPCDSVRNGKQKKRSKKEMHVESSLSESVEETEEQSFNKKSKTSENGLVDSTTMSLSASTEQTESCVSETCDNETSSPLSKKGKKKKRTKKSEREETNLNTSILRCGKDRKKRLSKSVSFSAGGDEIFMIPSKEDSGQTCVYEPEEEEEASSKEKSSKTKTKKRKRGLVEDDDEEEEMNLEEKPSKTKNLKRKRGMVDPDQETLPKKKKKSAKQEGKSARRKKKKSVEMEEDSSDDQMSKENSQAKQLYPGKGEKQQLENVLTHEMPSKKERKSRNSGDIRETMSKSKVCEANSYLSVCEGSASHKDRQTGLQTVSPVQVFPEREQGKQTSVNLHANTLERECLEEAKQNACSKDKKSLPYVRQAVLEEKCKIFIGANLASIKGYGC